MTTYVKDDATWKAAENIYVRDEGVWKQVKEAYVRDNGAWQRAHLRVLDLTIASDTSNYNVYAAAAAAGWNKIDVLTANVRIDSGIVVSATSTNESAIFSGPRVLWPATSSIEIHNNGGFIVGQGGNGGNGGFSNENANPTAQGDGAPGGAGGNAILAHIPITIHNRGTIAGGGGGGGGGGGNRTTNPSSASGGGGGGGGQTGRTNSLGGTGGPAFGSGNDYPGSPGGGGTFASFGAGGLAGAVPDRANPGGPGGPGGSWGDVGVNGVTSEGFGGTGGPRGNYISGIANVTFAVGLTGTLFGGTV